MLSHWGKHMIVNARHCCPVAIGSPRIIEQFLADMVKKIDMKAYGRPLIERFGEGNKAGYTAIQLIETSHLALHLCNESGDGYFDIYSCKNYDEYVAKAVIQQWFKPHQMDMKIVLRDAKSPMQ